MKTFVNRLIFKYNLVQYYSESGVGSAILPLLACKRDMTSHLVNLGISGKRGQGEAEVSESGAGE